MPYICSMSKLFHSFESPSRTPMNRKREGSQKASWLSNLGNSAFSLVPSRIPLQEGEEATPPWRSAAARETANCRVLDGQTNENSAAGSCALRDRRAMASPEETDEAGGTDKPGIAPILAPQPCHSSILAPQPRHPKLNKLSR